MGHRAESCFFGAAGQRRSDGLAAAHTDQPCQAGSWALKEGKVVVGASKNIVDELYGIYQANKDEITSHVLLEESIRVPTSELTCLPMSVRVRWIEDGFEHFFACLRRGESIVPSVPYLPVAFAGDARTGSLASELVNVLDRTPFFIQTLVPEVVRAFCRDPDYLCSLLDTINEGMVLYTQGYVTAHVGAYEHQRNVVVEREVLEAVDKTRRDALAALTMAEGALRRMTGAFDSLPGKTEAVGLLAESICRISLAKERLNESYAADATAIEPGRSDAEVPVVLRRYQNQAINRLSEREREVGVALAQGLTNREIAERLAVSPHTVRNHVSHILEKMDLSNRSQIATVFARAADGIADCGPGGLR